MMVPHVVMRRPVIRPRHEKGEILFLGLFESLRLVRLERLFWITRKPLCCPDADHAKVISCCLEQGNGSIRRWPVLEGLDRCGAHKGRGVFHCLEKRGGDSIVR